MQVNSTVRGRRPAGCSINFPIGEKPAKRLQTYASDICSKIGTDCEPKFVKKQDHGMIKGAHQAVRTELFRLLSRHAENVTEVGTKYSDLFHKKNWHNCMPLLTAADLAREEKINANTNLTNDNFRRCFCLMEECACTDNKIFVAIDVYFSYPTLLQMADEGKTVYWVVLNQPTGRYPDLGIQVVRKDGRLNVKTDSGDKEYDDPDPDVVYTQLVQDGCVAVHKNIGPYTILIVKDFRAVTTNAPPGLGENAMTIEIINGERLVAPSVIVNKAHLYVGMGDVTSMTSCVTKVLNHFQDVYSFDEVYTGVKIAYFQHHLSIENSGQELLTIMNQSARNAFYTSASSFSDMCRRVVTYAKMCFGDRPGPLLESLWNYFKDDVKSAYYRVKSWVVYLLDALKTFIKGVKPIGFLKSVWARIRSILYALIRMIRSFFDPPTQEPSPFGVHGELLLPNHIIDAVIPAMPIVPPGDNDFITTIGPVVLDVDPPVTVDRRHPDTLINTINKRLNHPLPERMPEEVFVGLLDEADRLYSELPEVNIQPMDFQNGCSDFHGLSSNYILKPVKNLCGGLRSTFQRSTVFLKERCVNPVRQSTLLAHVICTIVLCSDHTLQLWKRFSTNCQSFCHSNLIPTSSPGGLKRSWIKASKYLKRIIPPGMPTCQRIYCASFITFMRRFLDPIHSSWSCVELSWPLIGGLVTVYATLSMVPVVLGTATLLVGIQSLTCSSIACWLGYAGVRWIRSLREMTRSSELPTIQSSTLGFILNFLGLRSSRSSEIMHMRLSLLAHSFCRSRRLVRWMLRCIGSLEKLSPEHHTLLENFLHSLPRSVSVPKRCVNSFVTVAVQCFPHLQPTGSVVHLVLRILSSSNPEKCTNIENINQLLKESCRRLELPLNLNLELQLLSNRTARLTCTHYLLGSIFDIQSSPP